MNNLPKTSNTNGIAVKTIFGSSFIVVVATVFYIQRTTKLVFATCLEQHMNDNARASNCLMNK